jgi:hypothetical protein
MPKLKSKHLALANVCAKNSNRPALAGVYLNVADKTLTATDSFALIKAPYDGDVEGINNMIIPATAIKKVKLKKKEEAELLPDSIGDIKFAPIDDSYPDISVAINNLIGGKDPLATVRVNAEYLSNLVLSMAKATGNIDAFVDISIFGNNEAIYLKAGEVEGLLMPVRT